MAQSKNNRKKIKLDSVFYAISEPLRAILSSTGASISHPSTKGDASEFQWLRWLQTYLPRRYEVSSGFVIDSEGYVSDQQDIIVYDRQYTPYLLNEEGIIYVPAESVYAIIEVKQELNKEYIRYAGSKIESVRALKRTSAPIPWAAGILPPTALKRTIGGLVCLKASWKRGLKSSFLIKALEQVKDQQKQIDIVCCLDAGSFVVSYEDAAIKIVKSTRESSLIFFFINLLSKLQAMGTAPLLKYEEYAKTLQNYEIKQ